MAIINCPSCNEQISDKAKECPKCQSSTDSTLATSTQSSLKVQRIKSIQSIQAQTMLALLLSIAGFVFYYWDGIEDQYMQQWVGMGTIIAGLVWYLINRIRISYLHRKFKR